MWFPRFLVAFSPILIGCSVCCAQFRMGIVSASLVNVIVNVYWCIIINSCVTLLQQSHVKQCVFLGTYLLSLVIQRLPLVISIKLNRRTAQESLIPARSFLKQKSERWLFVSTVEINIDSIRVSMECNTWFQF